MYQQVVNFITNAINHWQYPYAQCYIGIAEDAEDALFNRHGVNKSDPWWAYIRCDNVETARLAEANLISSLGTKGDSGGGNDNSIYLYAYLTTVSTTE